MCETVIAERRRRRGRCRSKHIYISLAPPHPQPSAPIPRLPMQECSGLGGFLHSLIFLVVAPLLLSSLAIAYTLAWHRRRRAPAGGGGG